MHQNNGMYQEEEMVILLNEKNYSDLSHNGQAFVREMFGHISSQQFFCAGKVEGWQKPDFYVESDGRRFYVSMKTGKANVVHSEYVDHFVELLTKIGVSKFTTDTILLYHYGDRTTDGSGKERIPYTQLMVELEDRIAKANKELNSNKKFVKYIVYRSIFKGADKEGICADYIYHGDAGYGVLVSCAQIMKHIDRRSYKYLKCLHIGPLLLRPHARYYGKEIKSEKKRRSLELYWPNLSDELSYIGRNYDG